MDAEQRDRGEAKDGEIRAHILKAREVIAVLGVPMPQQLARWLADRPADRGRVSVLCSSALEAAYIEELLGRGYQVYEVPQPANGLLFLDRELAFHLPGCEPIEDPFPLACRSMRERLGQYLKLVGTVEWLSADHRLLKLRANEYYWAWVVFAETVGVAQGERIKALAVASWIGGISMRVMRGVRATPVGRPAKTFEG